MGVTFHFCVIYGNPQLQNETVSFFFLTALFFEPELGIYRYKTIVRAFQRRHAASSTVWNISRMKTQICWCKYFFDFCWCGCINKIFGNMLQNRFFSIFDQNLSKINKILGITVLWAWSSYVNPFIWWVCHFHSTFWWFSEKCQKSRNFENVGKWPITPWEGLASIFAKSMKDTHICAKIWVFRRGLMSQKFLFAKIWDLSELNFFEYFENLGIFTWILLWYYEVVDANSKCGSTGRQRDMLAWNQFFDKNYICNSQGLPKYWLKRALDWGKIKFSYIFGYFACSSFP